MKKEKTPSCYIMGTQQLLVECANALLDKGYIVRGVISSDYAVKEWASKQGLPCIDKTQIGTILTDNNFDYFFSIINPYVLPLDLIKKAKKLSVNYHDSLLPQYAGVHSTSWAILNNETEHGISWHVITAEIDAGDILKQKKISIEKNETAFSLNLKCYQTALAAFKDLIVELKNSSYSRTPQNKAERTYYPIHQKVPGNGWISWENSAENIDRIVRALNIGQYRNRLGSPKFTFGEHSYTVTKIKILNKKTNAPPGTILDTFEDFLEISTLTHDVQISGIKPINKNTFVAKLKKGIRLYSPQKYELENFEQLSTQYAPYEYFWVKKILEYRPGTLPFLTLYAHKKRDKTVKAWEYSTKNSNFLALKKMLKDSASIEIILLSCWFVYLYLVGNKNSHGLRLLINGPEKNILMETELPFFIEFDEGMLFTKVVEMVYSRYQLLTQKRSYLQDVKYRYPELSEISGLIEGLVILEKNPTKIKPKIKDSLASFFIFITDSSIKLEIPKKSFSIDPYLSGFIKNIPEQFNQLINSIIFKKNIKISELQIIPKKEKRKILRVWNDTSRILPKKSLYKLFESQAKETPEKIALYHESRFLTYQALREKIEKLSFKLYKNGFRKKMIVGLYFDSGIDAVIAFLSMVRLGITYIPMDPAYIKHNLDQIYKECKIKDVLTDEKNRIELASIIQNKKLNLNITVLNKEFLNGSESKSTSNVPFYNNEESPMYILYTSGTTGKPKGVIIKNKSVKNLAIAQIKKLNLSPKSRVLQFSSISFDASIWEIYSTLISGGSLYIPPKGIFLVGIYLEEYILKHQINVMTLPPSILNTLSPNRNYALKTLIVAGEACPLELAKKWFNKCVLINAYGPTETTVCATMARISKKPKLHMPIGLPIDNTYTYVLNENMHLQPAGVIGELYVGGTGLATGYKDQDNQTLEKFIGNPYGKNKTSLLYKTGDIARWLPDGNLEYIGREDSQIKIRGFRIDLDMIRTALLKHKSIFECAIKVFSVHSNIKSLAAYIVTSRKKQPNTNELKKFLADLLPSYMIPNFFVSLDKLPLTKNGKIDYKTLPLPDLQERAAKTHYVAPTTHFEKEVAEIWATLLRVKKIGVHDDFFDLGGYSLLLTEMIVALENKLKFSFSLHSFLMNPTIETLSKQFRQKFKKSFSPHNFDFVKDTELNLKFDLNHLKKSSNLNFILLTGATGFLGAHLLTDLCRSTKAKIICLVRAETDNVGFLKLKKAIKKYKLSVDWNRILPLKGDLANPLLDLSETQFLDLADKVDAIYHCGAYVHHLYGYKKLKPTNVSGTLELLKLATTIKIKDFHYISTLSAADGNTDKRGSIREDFVDSDTPPYYPVVLNGYNQTKWVCERLLHKAKRQGVPVNIYRPGWLIGQSKTGICQLEDQHFLMLIKGCLQLGYAPSWDLKLDILPVDFVSRAITAISLHKEIPHNIFNFGCADKITWVELVNWMNNNGFNINLVEPIKWKDEHLADISSDNALFSLLSFYLDRENRFFDNEVKNGNKTPFPYTDVTHTKEALSMLGIPFLKIEPALLTRFFNFLITSGFLSSKRNITHGEELNYV